jgi:hypothetical protein
VKQHRRRIVIKTGYAEYVHELWLWCVVRSA